MDANERMIAALEANTAAMKDHTAALNNHATALNNQAEEIKHIRRLMERLTEDYKNGGRIGVQEATDRLGKIAMMFRDSADKIEYASKRIADSSRR